MSKCRCGHDATDDNFKIEPISQHTLKVPVQYKGQAEPLDFTEPDATERARRMHSQSLANDKITKSTAELMVAFLESETPRIKADAVREFEGKLAKLSRWKAAGGEVPDAILWEDVQQVAKEMTEVD